MPPHHPQRPCANPGPLTQNEASPFPRVAPPVAQGAPPPDICRQTPGSPGGHLDTHPVDGRRQQACPPGVPGMDPPPGSLHPSPPHPAGGNPEGPGPVTGQLGAGPDDRPPRCWESILQFEAGETSRAADQEGHLLRLPKIVAGRGQGLQGPPQAPCPEVTPTARRGTAPAASSVHAGPLEAQGSGPAAIKTPAHLLPEDRWAGVLGAQRREAEDRAQRQTREKAGWRVAGGAWTRPSGQPPNPYSDPNFSPRRGPCAKLDQAPLSPGKSSTYAHTPRCPARPPPTGGHPPPGLAPTQGLHQTSLSHSSSPVNPRLHFPLRGM